MNILMVTAEAVPFAKTGGLADVCNALPKFVAEAGHKVSVFLPGYRHVFQSGIRVEPTGIGFPIELGGHKISCRILQAKLPGNETDFYFVDQPQFFDREALYGDAYGDYQDNCQRFSFFAQSVLHATELLQLKPDIVHCHDWQSGLVPVYIKTNFRNMPWYSQTGVITTIHNLAYQGRFSPDQMPTTGLDWSHYNWRELEFYGDICFLKSAIVFADRITTVSPTYAQEIQTKQFGCGLEGVLSAKSDSLHGIVNGVDYSIWDPSVDKHIAENYCVDNWQHGKPVCKKALQRELGLREDPSIPLVGLVGRMASQKGWDLIIPVIQKFLDREDVQWAVLGSGDQFFEKSMRALAEHAPDKIGVSMAFAESLAHRIEAGADLFLMPSAYEPCGLNQLYSLRYGTVPVVNRVGGLADTVVDTNLDTIHQETATGFAMDGYNTSSLENTIMRACKMYRDDQQNWRVIVERGMCQDWSWSKSAHDYVETYSRLVRKVQEG